MSTHNNDDNRADFNPSAGSEENETWNEIPPPPTKISHFMQQQQQESNNKCMEPIYSNTSSTDEYDGATLGTDTMDVMGAAKMALGMEISQGVSESSNSNIGRSSDNGDFIFCNGSDEEHDSQGPLRDEAVHNDQVHPNSAINCHIESNMQGCIYAVNSVTSSCSSKETYMNLQAESHALVKSNDVPSSTQQDGNFNLKINNSSHEKIAISTQSDVLTALREDEYSSPNDQSLPDIESIVTELSKMDVTDNYEFHHSSNQEVLKDINHMNQHHQLQSSGKYNFNGNVENAQLWNHNKVPQPHMHRYIDCNKNFSSDNDRNELWAKCKNVNQHHEQTESYDECLVKNKSGNLPLSTTQEINENRSCTGQSIASGLERDTDNVTTTDCPQQNLEDTHQLDHQSTFVHDPSHKEIAYPRLSPSTEVFLAKNEDSESVSALDQSNQTPLLSAEQIPNDGYKKIQKKPFLRKGSRKEPSALHRFKENEQLEQEYVTHVARKTEGDSKKKNLEKLEKLQRDQIEQLEQRIKRRESAREKMKKKQGSNKRILKMESNNAEACSKIKFGSDRSGKKLSCLDSDDGSDCNTKNASFNNANVSSDVQSESKNVIENNPNSTRNNISRQNFDEQRNKKKPTATVQFKTRKESLECLSQSPPRLTNKKKDKLFSSDFSKEINGQWQVIKSMRKRQELALRAAEKEREEARSWATTERESVQKWADQQRALIQKEKQRTSNATMISQRRKKKEEIEEKAAAASESSYKQSRAEIEALKATIHRIKIEADAAKSRYRLNEKRLKDCISEKDRKILLLEEKISNLKEKNHQLVSIRNEFNIEQKNTPGKDKKRMKQQTSKKPQKNLQVKATRKPYIEESTICDQTCESNCDIGAGEKKEVEKIKPEAITVSSDNDKELLIQEESKQLKFPKPDVIPDIHAMKKLLQCDPENDSISQQMSILGSSNRTDLIDEEQPIQNPVATEKKYEENHDKEAIHVIASYKDLIEEPTEQWLQRHLEGLQNSEQLNAEENSIHYIEKAKIPETLPFALPTSKKYNPNIYSEGLSNEIDVGTSAVSSQMQSMSNTNASHQFHTPMAKNSNVSEGRTEQNFADGRKLVSYHNGTQKEILPDKTCIVRFNNGDIKTTYASVGIVIYYYASAKTSHTSHPDGLEIFEFNNGQTERHYPNGQKEIHFPDGTKKIMFPDGGSKTEFPDGIKVVEFSDGSKEIVQF